MNKHALYLLPLVLIGCESSTSTQCTNQRSNDPACVIHDKANVQDTIAPTADAKSIVSGTVTDTSLTVSWAAATDNLPGELEYLVVAVKVDSFETTLEALKEGLASQSDLVFHSDSWARDVTSGTINGLASSTDYYVTVLVRDLSGNTVRYDVLTMRTYAAGTSGMPAGTAIAASNITPWTVKLTWGAATSPAGLAVSYKAVKAASAEAIDTIEEIEALPAASVILDWTEGTTSVVAKDLQPATPYFFAVLAKDAAGSKALYESKSATTAATPPYLTMFVTDDTFTVPFSSGTGSNAIERADSLCNADAQADGKPYRAAIVDGTRRRACLTPNCSGENESLDWPFKPNMEYRMTDRETIIGTTNAKGILPSPLSNPLLALFAVSDAWIGVKSDWTKGDNCSDWTATSNTADHMGWKLWTTTSYLEYAGNCDYQRYLVCVGTTAPEPDTKAPTVGSAIESDSSITSSYSIGVKWGRATDNVTPRYDLEYKLVMGASLAAIDTIAEVDAVTGSDLLLDWANNISHTVPCLSSDTEYYFAVLVRDAAGNKALYAPKAISTEEPVLAPNGVNPSHQDASASLCFQ